jgi:hypothetical protein
MHHSSTEHPSDRGADVTLLRKRGRRQIWVKGTRPSPSQDGKATETSIKLLICRPYCRKRHHQRHQSAVRLHLASFPQIRFQQFHFCVHFCFQQLVSSQAPNRLAWRSVMLWICTRVRILARSIPRQDGISFLPNPFQLTTCITVAQCTAQTLTAPRHGPQQSSWAPK